MGKLLSLPPRGHYLASEVGRLAGVSGDQIGQWARYGYMNSSQSSGRPRVYSYQDIAEAMAVHQLRDRGFSYPDIRAALESLREDPRYGDWPLSQAPIATTGRTVAIVEDGKTYDLSGRRWQRLLATSDLRKIALDLSRGGWAARDLPDLEHIEVNPDRMSGRPTIRGRRLRADKVARLAQSTGGRQVLKSDYELSEDEIRDAERWWQATERYEAA